jgi:hypothetical protein
MSRGNTSSEVPLFSFTEPAFIVLLCLDLCRYGIGLRLVSFQSEALSSSWICFATDFGYWQVDGRVDADGLQKARMSVALCRLACRFDVCGYTVLAVSADHILLHAAGGNY